MRVSGECSRVFMIIYPDVVASEEMSVCAQGDLFFFNADSISDFKTSRELTHKHKLLKLKTKHEFYPSLAAPHVQRCLLYKYSSSYTPYLQISDQFSDLVQSA